MHTKSYAKLKLKKENFEAHLLYFHIYNSNIKITNLIHYIIHFEFLENWLFSLLKQIALEQWILGYSKGNTLYQLFKLIGFFQLFSCFCLHCNNPIISYSVMSCSLPLCTLMCIVLSMICGFTEDFLK